MKPAKSGLDLEAPEKDGRARDAWEVARTGMMLLLHAEARDREALGANWLGHVAARHAVNLHIISGKLHRIAEAACNGDPSRGALLREARLQRQAQDIVEAYGLRCYFQADPRGCALYLIPNEIVPTRYGDLYRGAIGDCQPSTEQLQHDWIDSNYTRGHAVVRLGR